jgi:hypothetical protein
MITFIFCVCSCLIGIAVGGLLVDARRRRELARYQRSHRKLIQIVNEQDKIR